jgi:hypothetical protein
MTSSFRKASIVVASCQQRLRAIDAHLDPATKVPVDGRRLTPKQVAAAYRRSLETRERVVAAEAVLKKALAERDAAEKERQVIDRGLRNWIKHAFPLEVLLAFGFEPDKSGYKSPEVLAVAAEKARATRLARKTMGKKQRLAIRGSAD